METWLSGILGYAEEWYIFMVLEGFSKPNDSMIPLYKRLSHSHTPPRDEFSHCTPHTVTVELTHQSPDPRWHSPKLADFPGLFKHLTDTTVKWGSLTSPCPLPNTWAGAPWVVESAVGG